jgi:hypothetical protein
MYTQGHLDEAYRMLNTALTGYRELDSPPRIDLAETLHERGEISLARGHADEALADAQDGLATLEGQEAPTELEAELHGLLDRATAKLGNVDGAHR